ncbi:MAG: hypothetical protein C9356_03230 [Oleiphilus sp.]|nr:MAG: hypothetical protein C9356_03230 [Oleiphilus sp.]
MRKTIKTLALAALFLVSASSHAVVILEDDFSAGFASQWQTGWASHGSVAFVDSGSEQYVDMDGGRLRTNSNITFEADVLYRLSFDLANNDNQSDGRHRSIVTTIDNLNGNPYLAINEDLDANTSWQRYSYDFLGTGVSGRLVFRGDLGNNMGLLLDNVRLESIIVGEPATIALLGLGILGLGLTRSRMAS